jgi:hypothetical protein
MNKTINPDVSVSSLVNAAISSHNKLYRQIDQIEDEVVRMIPPYDDEKLKDQNADWANNWSFGKGKSQVERLVSQAQQQITNSLVMMSIDWDVFNEDVHKEEIYDFLRIPHLRKEVGQKIVRCFLEAISKDRRLIPMIGQTEFNAILYGYGISNPNEISYLGDSIHRRKVAFPPKSKETTVNSWVVFDVISIPFLFGVYESILNLNGDAWMKSSMSKSDYFYEGWNIKELCSILQTAYSDIKYKKEDMQRADIQWPEVGIYLKGSNCYTFVNSESVNIAKVREISSDRKTITETYVSMSMGSSDDMYAATASQTLFKKTRRFSEKEDLCLIRDFSVSPSQYLEDIAGMGIMIAEMSMRYNRTRNSAYDKATLGDCLTMQQSGVSQTAHRAELSVGGGQLILPNGWTMTADQYRPNLTAQIGIMDKEEDEYRKNTYHYDPQMNLTSRPTKDEVQARQAESISVRNTRMPVKLTGYAAWLSRCLKCISENSYSESESPEDSKIQKRFFEILGEEFNKFSLEKSEIKKVLKSISSVSLRPVLTDIGAIKEAMSLADTEQARSYLQASYLIAVGFSREDVQLIISTEYEMGQLEIASIENALFQTTGEIVFTPGQDHITHLNTHYAKIDREFMALQSGKDPVMVFNFAGNALGNCEKHVEALRVSPFYQSKFKEFAEIHGEMVGRYKKLASYVQQMKKQAEAQAQEMASGEGGSASGGQQLTPEEQIQIRKAEQELKFDEMKSMQKLQQKQQLFEQRMEHVKSLKKEEAGLSQQRESSTLKISEIKAAADSARKIDTSVNYGQ